MKNVDVITLGCSKNLVDSERLIAQFKANGFMVTHDSDDPKGDIAIINTCGFIGDAKEESIDMILGFAEAKKDRGLKKLIVMGCLSERHGDELKKEIPEIDAIYGKFDWKEIISDLGQNYRADLLSERSLTTPSHYAYLKISEGCNRTCSYCAIPIITGKHKSTPIEELVAEANNLANNGVKELQLIAQDLSYYGIDIYKKHQLAELVTELSKIDKIEWIRLHYAYPAGFPFDVLPVIANNPKVCTYLDLALQHISDDMLKAMRRNVTKADTLKLINDIRKQVPNIHLRTTLITGHPNETEDDFNQLLDFVKEARFERLGVFPYSHEEDTYSYINYSDNVDDDVKQERAQQIMDLQEQISWELNQTKIGSSIRVIVDSEDDDYYVARTEFDSPEVDPEVLIDKSDELKIGEFYDVNITDADVFDLFAENPLSVKEK